MTEDEYDAFYRAAVHRVIGQLHAMLGDREEAQDVAQEAFARAWDRRARLSELDDPEAWVRTVAWRLGISRLRRVRTARTWFRRQGPPDTQASPNPDHVALIEALKQLPPEQCRAIVLHHLADRSVDQIAAETGSPSGTVKARLSRGRATLAVLLSDPELEARYA